jgi:hypothetical protein
MVADHSTNYHGLMSTMHLLGQSLTAKPTIPNENTTRHSRLADQSFAVPLRLRVFA